MGIITVGDDCPECGYSPHEGHEATLRNLVIEYTCEKCGYEVTEYIEEDYFA